MSSQVSVYNKVIKKLIPWLGFWVVFAWGWRVQNFFTHFPGVGDALEVLWGIRWYHSALLVQHSSPLFTSLVFHPIGWHTATLAHTPLLFLLALPLNALGGLAFAYNSLAIGALIISFAGMYRFLRLFVSWPVATLAALVYTFWGMIWGRVIGHLNVEWMSGLLPWLAWGMVRSYKSGQSKWLVFSGLTWGLIINFSLYGIFIGATLFLLLWGCRIFREIPRVMLVGFIAIMVSLPTILLYKQGASKDQTHVFGIRHNVWWGASLNSIFAPFGSHPLPSIRSLYRLLYKGRYDESAMMNFGLVTSVLSLGGMVIVLRNRLPIANLIGLTLGGTILGMGVLLQWDGEVVSNPIFRPLNAAVWNLGRVMKPAIFSEATPPPPFDSGVPLPGFLLTALIPFWENARTVCRFAVLGMLGAVTLSGITLDHLPKVVRVFLSVIWLVEMLPHPTWNAPVPRQLHPAYAWLANQTLRPGEGIADIFYPTLIIRGEILWAAGLHGKPTVSGAGSSLPGHTIALFNYLHSYIANDPTAISQPQVVYILQQYRVQYLFLHVLGEKEKEMWSAIKDGSVFKPIGCFDPLPHPTPWPYPICVAEVPAGEGSVLVLPERGWSYRESWGIWAEGRHSTVKWFAAVKRNHLLRINAHPLCIPGQRQQISIRVNGKEIGSHQWEGCERWEAEIPISGSMVRVGWNEILFEYAYAKSPKEITYGQNPDSRILSVGFTVLEVKLRP